MKEILKSEDATKIFKKQKAVDNLNITINEGDIYALLGLNGAGKTTFMKLVLKHLRLTSGKIALSVPESKIGVIVETPTFVDELNGYDNLKMHALLTDTKLEKIDEVLNVVGLEKDKKLVKKYSLGMKQRLAIARALLTSPSLLILDEPINGLDPTGVYEIRSLLLRLRNEYNMTILISSHILKEVESIATKYGIIHHGKTIAEFSADEIDNYTSCLVSEVSDYSQYRHLIEKMEIRPGFVASALLDKQAYFFGKDKFFEDIPENFTQTKATLEEYFIAVTGGTREV